MIISIVRVGEHWQGGWDGFMGTINPRRVKGTQTKRKQDRSHSTPGISEETSYHFFRIPVFRRKSLGPVYTQEGITQELRIPVGREGWEPPTTLCKISRPIQDSS